MDWIPQRTDEDCGCAALAMLLGLTYEQIAKAWIEALGGGPRKSSYRDLIAIAEHLGVELKKSSRPDSPCIRRVRANPGDRHSHWVVIRDDLCLCPTVGVQTVDAYPWQAWGHGLRIIAPER